MGEIFFPAPWEWYIKAIQMIHSIIGYPTLLF